MTTESKRLQFALRKSLLASLEVVEEDGTFLRLLTPVLDNDARAVDDLAGVSFAVELAYTPRSKD
jgi:hypothetical protein